jgi:nucleoid-associated protein YgaU
MPKRRIYERMGAIIRFFSSIYYYSLEVRQMLNNIDFEAFIHKAAEHETSPIIHKTHPELSLFFDEMAGDLSPEAHARFVAHLATCPECRTEWQTLTKTFDEEEKTLSANARVSNLVELARRHAQPRFGVRLAEWLYSLWPAPDIRPVLVAAVASVAITLAVVIPTLYNPMVATSGRIADITHDLETLQGHVKSLVEGGATIFSNSDPASEVTLDELAQLASDIQGIVDPWQRSLIIAASLSSHGVTYPRDLDWFNLSSYTIQSDDTWKSIARREFGSPALWPLIWVLNADKEFPNEVLPAGEKILLPSPLE